MMAGIEAVSIPAMRAAEFNSKMVEFYTTRDATPMMGFVLECHPEYSRIRELNPELSLVRDAPAFRQYRFDDPLPQADHSTAPARCKPEIPEASYDPTSKRNERGAPARGRDADFDPSG